MVASISRIDSVLCLGVLRLQTNNARVGISLTDYTIAV